MTATKGLDVFRECRVCGRRYLLGGHRKTCICGGHTYTITQVYQPKVRNDNEAFIGAMQLAIDCHLVITDEEWERYKSLMGWDDEG